MNIHTPIDWLMMGPPWVQVGTLTELLGVPRGDARLQEARAALLRHELVQGIIGELTNWPEPPLASHRSAGHPLHKLSFLAEIGVGATDPGMEKVIVRVLNHQSEQGPFQMVGNISPKYGGTGEDVFGWALCDAPLVTYSLVQMGLGENEAVKKSIQHLTGLVRENGWPCGVSPEMGKWRGPGRKDDPCPYATLLMLKLLAKVPEMANSRESRVGTESILSLWSESRTRHPYIFYMGNDFRKLKAPLVWYDLLHVCAVLACFPHVRNDYRFQEMMEILAGKASPEGKFTPESIYTAWSDWDFGQKKKPSEWLTLLAWRMIHLSTQV